MLLLLFRGLGGDMLLKICYIASLFPFSSKILVLYSINDSVSCLILYHFRRMHIYCTILAERDSLFKVISRMNYVASNLKM